MADAEKNATPIKASELIEKIENEEISVEVFGDEDCSARLMHTTIEADADGKCSVTVYYYYREDQPNYGVSAGYVEFDLEGVHFSADRDFDGGHDDFEMSGREIVYDNDLSEEDIQNALEENVYIPDYDGSSYEFEPGDFSIDEIVDSVEDAPEVFAEHGGEIYGFDGTDEVPEGYDILDSKEAIRRLVSSDDVQYEQWG